MNWWWPAALLLLLGLASCGESATDTPSAQVKVESQTVQFTTEDNLRLSGRLFDGGGEVGVVLSHMFPADQSSWWEFASELAGEGYIALAYDFRGYGQSEGSKEISIINRDVRAALEFMRGRGAGKIVLMGASMGGTASLRVAATRPVAGVVALSAPVEFQGLSVRGQEVRVPVLLLAEASDGPAASSVRQMVESGLVGGPDPVERLIFAVGGQHGTDILSGSNGLEARRLILDFLKALT